MIRIFGEATYKMDYVIDLEMTEEDFDALNWRQQKQIVDDNLNMEDFQNLEIDDAEVHDLIEIDEDGARIG